MMRMLRLSGLLALAMITVKAEAFTLWSIPSSYLGTGQFFGPGAFPNPTPLFPAMIRNMAFTTDRDFVTPFWNNGADAPNTSGEGDFPPVDGLLSDGTKINENVDLGSSTLAGTRYLPAVAEGGELSGQQLSVTMRDGNLIMIMDLVLDLGFGERGIVRMPFYGTTGTATVPEPFVPEGRVAAQQAGPLKSGETISGRIGDFNDDGFIDGSLVATGTMPLDSPVYPGQPWALVRHFETDVPIDGAIWGSPRAVHNAYHRPRKADKKETTRP